MVRSVETDGFKIKLQVWDTAGQERFRSVTSAYYRGSMGAVVCYDCTDETTFKNAENWIIDFTNKSREDAPKILVANKCDLKEGLPES